MRLRLAVAGIVFAIAGCATTAPTPAATASPSPNRPTASPAPTASSGPVAIDPSLLDHLPPQVDGLDVVRSPEFDELVAADSAVVAYGEEVVTAVVADPGTDGFATVTILHLRPDIFDDQSFREWRDSFDSGVCERAGGVTGNAEATIGGHLTYIGTCAEGVRTYHVWLRNSRVLVSVSALGDRKLGERLVEALKD